MARRAEGVSDPFMAELKSLEAAINLAASLGANRVEFEVDAQLLIQETYPWFRIYFYLHSYKPTWSVQKKMGQQIQDSLESCTHLTNACKYRSVYN